MKVEVSAMTEIERGGGTRRSLWRSLREDPAFRATFIGVFVIPAVLMLATAGWIVAAMARS